MPMRAGWVPCVGIQPPKPSVLVIEEAATVTQECEGVLTGGRKPAQGGEFIDMQQPQLKPNKPAMKLVMNPKGVQDHTTVEQHYQQLLEQAHIAPPSTNTGGGSAASSIPAPVPASPEIVKDIINDMQSPTGKGAALFAKRKKRMDKFIVDETNVQKTSAYQQEQQGFTMQNTSTEKSSISQFSSSQTSNFSSSSSSSVQKTQQSSSSSSTTTSSKKKWKEERDREQQQIMEDFMKHRESEFKLVKSPWEAVLETGNTSSAFQKNMQTAFSSSTASSSSATGPASAAPWLEMPKPVPVIAPLPGNVGGGAPPQQPAAPPPAFKPAPAAAAPGPLPNEGAVATGQGLVYTAEVKVQQPSSLPQTPVSPASAAPAAPAAAAPSAGGPVAFIPQATGPMPFAPSAAAPAQPPPAVAAPAPAVVPAATAPAFKPAAVPRGAKQPALVPASVVLTPAEIEDRRRSANFNLAASGWGSNKNFYRPISFASS